MLVWLTGAMSQMPPRPPSSARRGSGGQSDADAALAARLERLNQRRAGAGAPASGARGQAAGAGSSSRRTRRHPARQARAAAIGLTLGATAALTSFFNIGTGGVQQVAAANIVSGPSTSTSTPAASGPVGPVAPSTTQATASGQPTVVDGAVYHNRWGDVQVEATFGPDGSLVNVDAIQTPDHRGTSIQINDYAVPRLDQEALSIQSAQIHVISGATYTSVDYARSLQSAIDAARAANVTQLS